MPSFFSFFLALSLLLVPQSQPTINLQPDARPIMCHDDSPSMSDLATNAAFIAAHANPIAANYDLKGKAIEFKTADGVKERFKNNCPFGGVFCSLTSSIKQLHN
jgi:hypothetical protein